MLKYLVSLLCFSAAAQAFNVADTSAQARQSFWPNGAMELILDSHFPS